MILNKKNISFFILILILGLIIGSFIWELIERIIHLFPNTISFTLTMKKPYRLFDFYVLAIDLRVNPGTIIGIIAGFFIFKGISNYIDIFMKKKLCNIWILFSI